MIVVLEGPEGAWKSSIAAQLQQRHSLVPYRALAPIGGRLSSDELFYWRGVARVPVNTLVDDVYVADLIAKLAHFNVCPPMILDRSMPSGVAYNVPDMMAPGTSTAGTALRLLDWWSDRMAEADARLVILDVETATALERLPPGDTRRDAAQLAMSRSRLMRALALVTNLPTLRLDTTKMTFAAVLAEVEAWLGLTTPFPGR